MMKPYLYLVAVVAMCVLLITLWGYTQRGDNDTTPPLRNSEQGSLEAATSTQDILFTGNTTFRTVDDNGDGLAEAVIAAVEVNILTGGKYSFMGSLKKQGQVIANRPFFDSAIFSTAPLNKGPEVYTLFLRFSGEQIFRAGENGPYELELFAVFGENRFAAAPPTFTNPYDYKQFGEVEGSIMSITDVVLDDNSNGKLDFIETTVTVEIRTAGDYQLRVSLSKEGTTILSVLNSFTLRPKTHTLKLQLPGQNIRRMGLDGPYQGVVNLIEVSKQQTVDGIEFVTQAYLSETFEVLLELDGTLFDQGIDKNGNGLFDILRISFGADVTKAGTFLVRGGLATPAIRRVVYTETLMTLSTGSQTLTLNFPGSIINEQIMDGPYQVEVEVLDSNTSNYLDGVRLGSMTKAYHFTDFEPLSRRQITHLISEAVKKSTFLKNL